MSLAREAKVLLPFETSEYTNSDAASLPRMPYSSFYMCFLGRITVGKSSGGWKGGTFNSLNNFNKQKAIN